MTQTRVVSLKSRYWPKVRGIIAYGAGPALGLASGPLLARAMGPDGRGQFAAIMQPLTLAGAIASIGIPAAATYFVAKSEYNSRSVLLRGFVVSAFFAMMAYGILYIYSVALSERQDVERGFLLLVWTLIFVSAAIQIQRGYIQGRAGWRRLDLERFSFAILRFIAVVLLALLGFSSAEEYVVGSLAAFVLAGAILWWPRGRGALRDPSPKKIPYSVLTKYSLSAALGTIAVVANNRMDQVLLPLMSDSAEVGFYAVAVTVAEVPIILGTLAARDALYEASRGGTPMQVVRGSGVYLGGATLLGVLLALFAPVYMGPVFGASFEGAVGAVQVLCLGTIAACIALTLTSIIIGAGRPALSSAIPLCGLVVTAILFWVYSSVMTSVVAAIIAALSQVFSVLTGLFVLRIISYKSKRVLSNNAHRSAV